jgi:LIM homeobox protein 3/4
MKGGSSPSKLLDKDELKVDLDSFSHHGKDTRYLIVQTESNRNDFTSIDLSNDSYSTINMGLDDGASPHSGRNSYIHSSASPPPYLSSHSPNPMSQNHHYSYPDNIVYTPLGKWLIKAIKDTRIC